MRDRLRAFASPTYYEPRDTLVRMRPPARLGAAAGQSKSRCESDFRATIELDLRLPKAIAMSTPDQLEVVFYSGAAPTQLTTMTLLGLLFDRVHFPNVRVPLTGFDPEWVTNEVRRIEQLGLMDYDTWLLLQLMRYAINPDVQQFFYFTADKNQVLGGDTMKRATPIVELIYNQLFPPRPGFTPMFTPGCHKGLPYQATIDYPGAFYYQANALLYAGEHGIPLLNDVPSLPVPALAEVDAKHNTKLLATIMAMECAQLVLPEVGEMQPRQIVEAREDLKPYLKPFRMSLLGFAGKLNSAIEASSDYGEIKRAAEFIAQTEVYPQLEEFKNALAKSHQRGWWPRTWEFGKQSVSLGALYSAGNFPAALIGTAKALGSWFIAGITDETPRSGLHYLLKLQDHASPKTKS